jgi:predicted transcriptional regulator of viral defense system
MPVNHIHREKKESTILRMSTQHRRGITGNVLQARIDSGKIIKLKPGYYAWADQIADMTGNEITTAVIRNGTLYHLSAAALYDLTTVIPDTVFIAVPNTGRTPKLPVYPPITLTAFKLGLFELGRTTIRLPHGNVPIYDRERTVCDLFKHRDEIGKDVVLEVIRNYMLGDKNIQRLYQYAQQMRLLSKLQPYVEALV